MTVRTGGTPAKPPLTLRLPAPSHGKHRRAEREAPIRPQLHAGHRVPTRLVLEQAGLKAGESDVGAVRRIERLDSAGTESTSLRGARVCHSTSPRRPQRVVHVEGILRHGQE
jgi:hypothetical protein